MVTSVFPSSIFKSDPFINTSAKQLAPNYYKTDTSPVAQVSLEFPMYDLEHGSLLLLCLEFWDYRHVSQHPMYAVLRLNPRFYAH